MFSGNSFESFILRCRECCKFNWWGESSYCTEWSVSLYKIIYAKNRMYKVSRKLTIFVYCLAEFHAACVDLWLTSWRTFCPVCKRDATSGVSELPATEATPLLSSAVRLPSQPSSFRSSVAASPPRPISRHPSSHSVSRAYSVSSTPHSPNPFRSHTNLPGVIHASRSTADLANMSSPHPRISHLSSSTHSLVGSHLSPPISIRYPLPHSRHESPSPHVSSPYISNSGYGSSSYYYLGGSSQHGSYLRRCGESGPSLSTMVPRSSQQQFQSEANVATGASSAQSSRQSYLRRCGDSDASLSDMASAQSLPGCWGRCALQDAAWPVHTMRLAASHRWGNMYSIDFMILFLSEWYMVLFLCLLLCASDVTGTCWSWFC